MGKEWWSLGLLFTSSFLPYATGLVSTYFMSKTMQGFYGIIVITTTVINGCLHKAILLLLPSFGGISEYASVVVTLSDHLKGMLIQTEYILGLGLLFWGYDRNQQNRHST